MDEIEKVGRSAFLQLCLSWPPVDGGSGEFRNPKLAGLGLGLGKLPFPIIDYLSFLGLRKKKVKNKIYKEEKTMEH